MSENKKVRFDWYVRYVPTVVLIASVAVQQQPQAQPRMLANDVNANINKNRRRLRNSARQQQQDRRNNDVRDEVMHSKKKTVPQLPINQVRPRILEDQSMPDQRAGNRFINVSNPNRNIMVYRPTRHIQGLATIRKAFKVPLKNMPTK